MELAKLGIFGTQNQHIGKNYRHYQKGIKMSELISGKDAFGYLSMGADVLVHESTYKAEIWRNLIDTKFSTREILEEKVNGKPYKLTFKLKPRTITLNGVEVPAPFEPKIGEYVYFISSDEVKGYAETTLVDTEMNWGFVQFGAWRTEVEIKQVVAALRSVFNERD